MKTTVEIIIAILIIFIVWAHYTKYHTYIKQHNQPQPQKTTTDTPPLHKKHQNQPEVP